MHVPGSNCVEDAPTAGRVSAGNYAESALPHALHEPPRREILRVAKSMLPDLVHVQNVEVGGGAACDTAEATSLERNLQNFGLRILDFTRTRQDESAVLPRK